MRWPILMFAVLCTGCSSGSGRGDAAASASAQSPAPAAWEDQIFYFLLTDRFANGDSTNDDFGFGEYNPSHGGKYSGGDFAGLSRRLDYIEGLGATGIWLTPPVSNQWHNPMWGEAGYHGYWATDFRAVDAHLGTLADYRNLAQALHGRGMKLVQDIVVNHVGAFFRCEKSGAGVVPARDCRLLAGSHPRTPLRSPFDLLDPASPEAVAQGIFRFVTPIENWQDAAQRRSLQFSELNELNTSNPRVVRELMDAYRMWIREVGVDGFRLDTANFVEPEFWREFFWSDKPENPGMISYARSLGNADFQAFAEVGLGLDDPSENVDYFGTRAAPNIPSALNFALARGIESTFRNGLAPEHLVKAMEHSRRIYPFPERTMTFVDNHDGARFLKVASEDSLKLALLFLMTVPGIPTIYYGTEQGFTEARGAMFQGGFGSNGRDHYDTSSGLYRYIASVTRLRKTEPATRRSFPEFLAVRRHGPGALAYRVGAGEDSLLVLMNTGGEANFVNRIKTPFAAGTRLRSVFAVREAQEAMVDENGEVSLMLAPMEGLVLKAEGRAALPPATDVELDISSGLGQELQDDFELDGRARGVEELVLMVDGASLPGFAPRRDPQGGWSAELPVQSLADGRHTLLLAGRHGGIWHVREKVFSVKNERRLLHASDDPEGDDRGPTGTYSYPRTGGFEGQSDLRGLEVFSMGRSLEIRLTMNRPLNRQGTARDRFERTGHSIYLHVPGIADAPIDVLPRAQAPRGRFSWNRLVLAGEAGAKLWRSHEASETSFGTDARPGAEMEILADGRTVRFLLSAQALGFPSSLDGLKLYVTSFDVSAFQGLDYRALDLVAGDWSYGAGRDPAGLPKIMDDMGPFAVGREARGHRPR